MNLQTGVKEAKLIDPEEDVASAGEQPAQVSQDEGNQGLQDILSHGFQTFTQQHFQPVKCSQSVFSTHLAVAEKPSSELPTFKLLPPIHTGCAGTYAQRYTRAVRRSNFAVFGVLRVFWVLATHACSDTVRNVVRECIGCNHVWVLTPKICAMHDVITGCGIPNKFKLFSNCRVLLVTSVLPQNGARLENEGDSSLIFCVRPSLECSKMENSTCFDLIGHVCS